MEAVLVMVIVMEDIPMLLHQVPMVLMAIHIKHTPMVEATISQTIRTCKVSVMLI